MATCHPMWPNKAPTHPCHSFTDSHRGSIKPLSHSSFQIYPCPTLKHPTLLKTWKREAIRYKFFSLFIYTFLQTPKLLQHKSVQHLLLSLPSLSTLLPVAKEKKKIILDNLSKTNSFFYSLMLLRKYQLHHLLRFVALATIPPNLPLLSWIFRLILLI